ncbi:MAG TPA: ABC transporter permease [Oceanithermus profundus]|uniref:ABC transporter permease n=1 Tax=Oceanithermus profundus TaxID=187137 RepID=A0A7C4VBB7_9DEIN|nr:ABC transporter permease [Oceanithermus profundus]
MQSRRMKLQPVLSLASVALAAALLLVALASYQHAQARLRWLVEVAGKNVLIVQKDDAPGTIVPPGDDLSSFVARLPGYLRYALRAEGGRRPNAFDYYTQYVSEGYFSLRGYRFLKGHPLRQDADEAVVGFGLRDLLGKWVTVKGRRVRVVGVLASMADRGWPDSAVEEVIFLPWRLRRGAPAFFFEFASEPEARAALAPVQGWLKAHGYSNYEALPLANLYGLELRRKLRNVLGGALLWGVLAVVLVAAASLTAFRLARALERIRELGIRRAVGAARRDVLREELAASAAWTAWGLGLGWPLALALAGWFEARTGLSARPTAAATLTAAVGLLALSLAAAYFPARWAARQPPAGAVRGLAASLPQKRLGLAMLGLTLGVAAFAVQLGVNRSAEEHTRRMVGDLSSRTAVYSSFLFVGARSVTDPRGVTPLTYADYEALLASPLAGRIAALAYVEAYLTPLSGPAGRAYAYLRAYEDPYPKLAGAHLLAGRWPEPGVHEAVVGRLLAERLFGANDPLGKTLQALGRSWKIVGVYRGAGEALPGNAASDQLLVLRRDLGGTLPGARGEILVQLRSEAPAGTFEAVGRFLTGRHADPKLAPVRPFTRNDLAPEVRAVLLELAAAYRLLAVVILLLAGAGLAAQTLMIARLETRTLGVLRAVGGSRARVFAELLWPLLAAALLAGAVGTAAGAAVSFLVVHAQEATWSLPWAQLLFVTFAAPLLAAVFAAPPAWQAASVPPAAAMRSE